jgi:hypothetical protein
VREVFGGEAFTVEPPRFFEVPAERLVRVILCSEPEATPAGDAWRAAYRIFHGGCPSRLVRLCRARKCSSSRLCTLTSARIHLSILCAASRVSADTPEFIPSTMRFLTLWRAGEFHLEPR